MRGTEGVSCDILLYLITQLATTIIIDILQCQKLDSKFQWVIKCNI